MLFRVSSSIFPIREPFSREIAHSLELDPISLQQVVDMHKVNPFACFTFNAATVIPEKDQPNDSFIFFGGQLFFKKHQLSWPLFELVAKHNSLPIAEVDTLLAKFIEYIRNYPYSFILYKNKEYRLNKAHINKLLDQISMPPLSEAVHVDDYITSFFFFIFNYFKTNDADFTLGSELKSTFLEIQDMFKNYIGITDDLWVRIFENADFNTSFQLIQDLNLFPIYSHVSLWQIKNLRLHK